MVPPRKAVLPSVFCLLALLPQALSLGQTTLLVDSTGAEGAFTQIQAAIDSASDGDTVLVKPGEYVINEPITFRGKAITVKGENGSAETTIRMSDQPSDVNRASVVVFENGEAQALLEGVTLTGGQGTLADGPVTDLIRDSNWFRGGAVLCQGGSMAKLVDCNISRNSPGGVYCGGQSELDMERCIVRENYGLEFGSGVRCQDDSLVRLSACTISANVAHNGGGLHLIGGAQATLTDCTISDNIVGYGGGGFYLNRATANLTNCTVTRNYAYCSGGFFTEAETGQSTLTLDHCTVTGNVAEDHDRGTGSGLIRRASSLTITNSIVWGNRPESLQISNPSTVTHSCIRQSTFAVTPTEFQTISDGEVFPGTGNINEDPLFCGWGDVGEVHVDSARSDPGDGTEAAPYRDLAVATDYSLSLASSSPCLGAGAGGTNMGAGQGVCDLAPQTESRFVHVAAGMYDMAALNLFHHISLQGAGEKETSIRGSVLGLRSGTTLSHVTVTGATGGGGIRIAGESPEISHCTISRNVGIEDGGGLRVVDGSPTVTHCTISGNWVDESGGGVSGSATLIDCKITGNFATQDGGGVSSGRLTSLANCTISGNYSGREGGGLTLGGEVVATNCAIWGNRSRDGGGVFVTFGEPSLMSCTIVGNSATSGGGIFVSEESELATLPRLTNCIVWGNDGGAVAGESPLTAYSVVDDVGISLEEGNVREDPDFLRQGAFDFERFVPWDVAGTGIVALAIHESHSGRETVVVPDFVITEPDLHLASGSPAIDAGTPTGAPPTDLDGNARPCGGGFDIGAFESCPPSITFQRGDSNADGARTIVDGIVTLNFLFLGATPPPCLDAADANDSGELNIDDSLDIFNFLFLGGDTPPSLQSAKCRLDPTEDKLDCGSFSPCP